MRVISNSIMSALIVLALFWGNCLSCPEVLLALSAHQPAHSCCPRNHQPASHASCQAQALQHFVQAEKQAPPALAIAAMVQRPPVLLRLQLQPAADVAIAPAPTPPDLISLTSSFRI